MLFITHMDFNCVVNILLDGTSEFKGKSGDSRIPYILLNRIEFFLILILPVLQDTFMKIMDIKLILEGRTQNLKNILRQCRMQPPMHL